MAGGDKQGKDVSDAEQTWMCFSNAKGQGLSPSPWQGTSCPSLIAQGSSRATGLWGCAMPRAAPWGGPCQAAEQGQGGNEAPAQQGSLVLSCWPQAQGQQPWPKCCRSWLWQGLSAAAHPCALCSPGCPTVSMPCASVPAGCRHPPAAPPGWALPLLTALCPACLCLATQSLGLDTKGVLSTFTVLMKF